MMSDTDTKTAKPTPEIEALLAPIPGDSPVGESLRYEGTYDAIVSIVGPAGATPTDFQTEAAAVSDYLAADPDVEEAEVRDLLTEQVDPATGELVERVTRFTRVALEPGSYRDAISIGVIRPDDTTLDVLDFSDRIGDLLDSDELPLAEGFDVESTADFAVGVRQQLSSLSSNLLTGLLAVALVSFVLIGWRVALLTAGFTAVGSFGTGTLLAQGGGDVALSGPLYVGDLVDSQGAITLSGAGTTMSPG